MISRRITLKDIAQKESVSINAVSLALRNHHSISAAKRASIQETARKLGYFPDPLLSALIARRTNVENSRQAHVVAFVSDFPLDSNAMAPGGPVNLTFTGAQQAARDLGYKLDYFHLNDEIAVSNRLPEILAARGIRGLIFGPVSRERRCAGSDWQHFARITIGYHEVDLPFPYVIPNYAQGIAMAWEKLLPMGYRRIGLVTVDTTSKYVLQCWLSAHQFQQNLVSPGDRVPSLVTSFWSFDAFREWCTTHRPDALLTYNSAIFEWLAKMGLKVPADIGIVHLDRRPAHHNVAGVVQNKCAQGAAAMAQLNTLLQQSAYGSKPLRVGVTVDCSWNDGETLAKKALY